MTATPTRHLLVATTFALGLTWAAPAAPPGAANRPAEPADGGRVPVAVARDRAKLMHSVYAATLDSMHHHFFRRDRAVLPARALEDVFEELDRQSGIQARWIAVNTPAMSVDHEAKSAFERSAAAAIAAGKSEYEGVEDGYYRRAGAIPLAAGCVSCHARISATADKSPRFAGLVISVPVVRE